MSVPADIPRPVLPRRDPEAHKGRFGHVLVLGGSAGLSGAPRLAAAAALAAGSGLVSVAVPETLRAEVAAWDPALMVHGAAATSGGGLAYPALPRIVALAAERTALVVGPGAGRHPGTAALLRALLTRVERPAVVDADALGPGADAARAVGRPDRVMTPHPGEAARLLGCTPGDVQGDRVAAARSLWRRVGGVVVLKGHRTLVTDGQRLFVNGTGNPGLAVGGAGDVLAGLIGALLAQGGAPLEAACDAVWIHGRAADALLPETGARGMTPAALIARLPATLAACES